MKIRILIAGLVVVLFDVGIANAQPARQSPGVRPHFPPPTLNDGFPAANGRAPDIYGKKGYPRLLGDNVDASSGGGGATGNTGATGGLGGGGFQGNTGNQIGSMQGGTILGGLFGGGGAGGGGGQLGGGLSPPRNGFSGGGFTGLAPKGFGFGGTPDFTRSWTNAPLHGGSGN